VGDEPSARERVQAMPRTREDELRRTTRSYRSAAKVTGASALSALASVVGAVAATIAATIRVSTPPAAVLVVAAALSAVFGAIFLVFTAVRRATARRRRFHVNDIQDEALRALISSLISSRSSYARELTTVLRRN